MSPELQDYIRTSRRYDTETGKLFVRAGNGWRDCGVVGNHGYLVVGIKGKTYLVHRLAWFLAHGHFPSEIDHVNGDRTDNRLSNLRPCTRSENQRNRAACGATSAFRGVHWHAPSRKWRATARKDGKQLWLGYFETEADAAKAAQAASLVHDGEFSYYRRAQARELLKAGLQ